LDWWIEKETEYRNRFIELHIQLNPHKDAKCARNYAQKKIKEWQVEYKKSVKDALINFKKKYQKDADALEKNVHHSYVGTFWIEIYHCGLSTQSCLFKRLGT
jgi:hypothetical protein